MLNDKACEELGKLMFAMIPSEDRTKWMKQFPEQMNTAKKAMINAIKLGKEQIEREHLIPFHKWMHENGVPDVVPE